MYSGKAKGRLVINVNSTTGFIYVKIYYQAKTMNRTNIQIIEHGEIKYTIN